VAVGRSCSPSISERDGLGASGGPLWGARTALLAMAAAALPAAGPRALLPPTGPPKGYGPEAGTRPADDPPTFCPAFGGLIPPPNSRSVWRTLTLLLAWGVACEALASAGRPIPAPLRITDPARRRPFLRPAVGRRARSGHRCWFLDQPVVDGPGCPPRPAAGRSGVGDGGAPCPPPPAVPHAQAPAPAWPLPPEGGGAGRGWEAILTVTDHPTDRSPPDNVAKDWGYRWAWV